MRSLWVLVSFGVMTAPALASAATPVTVFLDRAGMVVDHDGESIAIPRFGGTTRTWNTVAACVQDKFSAFDVDVVTTRPRTGTYITTLVGGGAEQLGYDPKNVAGIGPSDGEVIPDATVHVFSRTIGESDAKQLCEVAAHEIGHALGLDHSLQCGDLMSYPREECGERVLTFVDADAPCGEYEARTCFNGDESQSSFGRLAALVGLRATEDSQTAVTDEPPAEPAPYQVETPYQVEAPPEQVQPAPEEVQPPPQARPCRHHRHRRSWRTRGY